MGAISKSEPISELYLNLNRKFDKDISELYFIYFPEYRCYGVHIKAVGNKSDEQYIWEL